MMGSRGLVAKFTTFEEAIRVPQLLRIPGADRNGTRIDAPFSQVDLVPTLLDALGRARGSTRTSRRRGSTLPMKLFEVITIRTIQSAHSLNGVFPA